MSWPCCRGTFSSWLLSTVVLATKFDSPVCVLWSGVLWSRFKDRGMGTIEADGRRGADAGAAGRVDCVDISSFCDVAGCRSRECEQWTVEILPPFFTALENWLVETGVFGFSAIQKVIKKAGSKCKGLIVFFGCHHPPCQRSVNFCEHEAHGPGPVQFSSTVNLSFFFSWFRNPRKRNQ